MDEGVVYYIKYFILMLCAILFVNCDFTKKYIMGNLMGMQQDFAIGFLGAVLGLLILFLVDSGLF